MMKAPFARQACYALALVFFLTLAYAADVQPPPPQGLRPTQGDHLSPKLRPVCRGPLPSERELDGADISGYLDLMDWCVRGPQDCSCVADPSTHVHGVNCNWAAVPWLPVFLCYGGCHCEKHDIDAFIAALERVLPPLDDEGGAIA